MSATPDLAYPYPTEKVAALHPDGWASIAPTPVLVEALVPTQADVSIARLRHTLAGGEPETGDQHPHVVLHSGILWVHDGHHRYVVALARGAPVLSCRVVEP